MNSSYWSSIANFSPDLGTTGKWPLRACAIFAKQKARNVEHEAYRRLTKPHKEASMECLILGAVVDNDGALRADHRRLPETARMVTVNRR